MKSTLNRRATQMLASLACGACVLSLSACSSLGLSEAKPETLFGLFTPYRVDVVQGNVVTQEVMAQIQPGLGRMQVREILGTPLLADPFHTDRWDYVFTIDRQGVPRKSGVSACSSRTTWWTVSTPRPCPPSASSWPRSTSPS